MLVLAMEFSRGIRPSDENIAVLGRNDKRPAGGLALPFSFPARSSAPRKRNRDGPIVGLPAKEAEASTMPIA